MRISVKAWLRMLVIKGQEPKWNPWQLNKYGESPNEWYHLSYVDESALRLLFPREMLE